MVVNLLLAFCFFEVVGVMQNNIIKTQFIVLKIYESN